MQENDANVRKMAEDTMVMQMNMELVTPKSKRYVFKEECCNFSTV